MKSIRLVIVVFFLAMLAACQPATLPVSTPPAPTQAPRDSSQSPPGSLEQGYPGAQEGSTSAYPGAEIVAAPQVTITRTPVSPFPPDMPVPAAPPGMATVTGHIVSKTSGEPLVDLPVSLAMVYRNELGEGAFAYDTAFSPLAYTDSNGRFIFTEIEPAEYIMVVGSVEVNRYEIITDSRGDGLLFTADADAILDTGAIRVGVDW